MKIKKIFKTENLYYRNVQINLDYTSIHFYLFNDLNNFFSFIFKTKTGLTHFENVRARGVYDKSVKLKKYIFNQTFNAFDPINSYILRLYTGNNYFINYTIYEYIYALYNLTYIY